MISKVNDFFDDELPTVNQPDFNYRQCELFSAPKKDSKKCRMCGAEKGLSAFYIYPSKSKSAAEPKYSENCKVCDRAIFRGRYATDQRTRAKVKLKNAKYWQQKSVEKKALARKPINLMKRLIESWIGRGRLELAIRLLGYGPEELVQHLTAGFQPGMSWDNYGFRGDKWNIDHIKPCCRFNLCDTSQFIRCHRLTNLRPQWATINQNNSGKRLGPG